MPAAMNEEEITAIVNKAIADSGAATMQDMGKVMNEVRPQLAGRADMAVVSKLVKPLLS
jgi:uncharacterized protein YqeY